MHMHPPRAFNIQYSNIYDLKLTSQTLYHFNLTMHRYPPRAIYTHYYNIYSLKLLPLMSYQYNIHQKRITINVHKKNFTTATSMAKKKKNLRLPKWLVTSLQTSMRTGRTVALKTAYLTGRDDTRTQNNISLATSSSSH